MCIFVYLSRVIVYKMFFTRWLCTGLTNRRYKRFYDGEHGSICFSVKAHSKRGSCKKRGGGVGGKVSLVLVV